jgi:putative mycofactocin binding protein MftB
MVAIRPEPFGALAYHYGNRRLTFLRSPDLVTVVRSLADHESVDETLVASNIEPGRRPALERALASLADSHVIRRRAS